MVMLQPCFCQLVDCILIRLTQVACMQRLRDGTRFGYGSDSGLSWEYTVSDSSQYRDPGWTVTAPGNAAMTCPGTAFRSPGAYTCQPEIMSVAPNMWDKEHKLYTVWVLEEDRDANTFLHKCVDAEFPHFPYAHYVEFSALQPVISVVQLQQQQTVTEHNYLMEELVLLTGQLHSHNEVLTCKLRQC